MENFASVSFLFIWLCCLNVLAGPMVTTSLKVHFLPGHVNAKQGRCFISAGLGSLPRKLSFKERRSKP